MQQQLTDISRAMIATVPVYLSEVSAPHNRGLIAGLSGLGISCGTMASNWVGFACEYAPYGTLQWRLPLAIQIPWGIILFIGLSTFMPNSPRELVKWGKVDEARREFGRIRNDLQSHEAQAEFALMRQQIEFEVNRENLTYVQIFKLYRYRVAVYVALICPNRSCHRFADEFARSVGATTMQALTGVNVIQVITS